MSLKFLIGHSSSPSPPPPLPPSCIRRPDRVTADLGVAHGHARVGVAEHGLHEMHRVLTDHRRREGMPELVQRDTIDASRLADLAPLIV